MLKIFFSFQGRLGRLRYIMLCLAVIAIAIVAARGFSRLVALVGVPGEFQVYDWLVLLTYGTALLASLSLMARRLHDINLSGWWTPSVFLLYVVQGYFQEADRTVAAILTGILVLAAQLAIIFIPGSKCANNFGEVGSSAAPASKRH